MDLQWIGLSNGSAYCIHWQRHPHEENAISCAEEEELFLTVFYSLDVDYKLWGVWPLLHISTTIFLIVSP